MSHHRIPGDARRLNVLLAVIELAAQSTDASDNEEAQTTAEEALLQVTKLSEIYNFNPIVVSVKEVST